MFPSVKTVKLIAEVRRGIERQGDGLDAWIVIPELFTRCPLYMPEKAIRLDEHGGGNRIYSASRLIALRMSASAAPAMRMACVSSLRSTALAPRSF